MPLRHEKSVRKTDAKPDGCLLYFLVGFLFQAPRNQDPTSSFRCCTMPGVAKRLPFLRLGEGLGGASSRPSLEWERFGHQPSDRHLETQRGVHFR